MALEDRTVKEACSGEQAMEDCFALQKPLAANANDLRCQVREQIRLSRNTFLAALQFSMYLQLHL